MTEQEELISILRDDPKCNGCGKPIPEWRIYKHQLIAALCTTCLDNNDEFFLTELT